MIGLRPLGFAARSYAIQLRLARVLEQSVFVLALCLLVWVPFPAGSVHPIAAMAIGVAGMTLYAIWWFSSALSARRSHIAGSGVWLAAIPWLIWLGWVFLQTVPLPAESLYSVASHRWLQLAAAFEYAGAGSPGTFSISVDPQQTESRLWLSAGYCGIFFALAAVLRTTRRRRALLWALALSGCVQALYGSLMVLSGTEWGAWGEKVYYRGFATGTFVSRNHFAGYLGLCIAAAAGLILAYGGVGLAGRRVDWRHRGRRLLAFVSDGPLFIWALVVAMFIGLMMSQSRGGGAAAIFGLLFSGVLYLLVRPGWLASFRALLLTGVGVVGIAFLGAWFRLDQLAERYATFEASMVLRERIVDDVREHVLPSYLPLGSGLGTFFIVYPEFRSPGLAGSVEHAHNDYIQFLAEVGYPGTFALASLIGLTAVRALLVLRRRRDRNARGMAFASLTAIGAVALHSWVDFSLQIPANALAFVALLAVSWSYGWQSRRRRRPERPGVH